MAYSDPEPEEEKRPLGIGGWIVILALVALLAGAVYIGGSVWLSLSDVGMSAAGWTFLILGIVVTFAVGAGLMGLVFYSSRNKFDR
jgi:hypothetical protein